MRLYPAAGLRIRDPITHAVIPATGVEVPDLNGIPSSFYWARLLRDKDVATTAPKATTTTTTQKASTEAAPASAAPAPSVTGGAA